jgi:hypothetical protein
MDLTLAPGERPVLTRTLGLAATASNAEIVAAVTERLTTTQAATGGTLNTVERDATITAAVRDGKFSADRAALYASKWDRDPEGTKRTIAKLQSGVALPEVAAGPDGYPVEWLRPPRPVGESRIHGGGD